MKNVVLLYHHIDEIISQLSGSKRLVS